MPLTEEQVIDQVKTMIRTWESERLRLDKLYAYVRGRQRFLWLPESPPDEVLRLANMARVNMLRLVVDVVTQDLYVDGYRMPKQKANLGAWDLWQRNRMDARQMGVHRAAMTYGASFVSVLPGDPVPVIRGYSPRSMTTLYGDNDEWPTWALEMRARTDGSSMLYRLFDDQCVYTVQGSGLNSLEFQSVASHNAGVVPVVRFRPKDDLDDDGITGDIEELLPIQDQINITTFGLLVSEHYAAFRQRYVIGWTAESETKLKASQAKLWTFEDSPDEIKVGEFEQTSLQGYIDSREASIRHLASISQTPVHELLGQLVNLSAEALEAAQASHERKVAERQTMFGEGWEQVLELGGHIGGSEWDPQAQVRWRDTSVRSASAQVDALGKLAQMLGVPVRALWELVPNATQQDIEYWEALAAEGDSFANLERMLERQAAEVA